MWYLLLLIPVVVLSLLARTQRTEMTSVDQLCSDADIELNRMRGRQEAPMAPVFVLSQRTVPQPSVRTSAASGVAPTPWRDLATAS